VRLVREGEWEARVSAHNRRGGKCRGGNGRRGGQHASVKLRSRKDGREKTRRWTRMEQRNRTNCLHNLFSCVNECQ
jgi:hypothetical protein